MKGLIAVLLLAVVGCLSYIIWDRERERKLETDKERITAIAEQAAQNRMEEDRAKRQRAILEGRAEIGMTRYELRKAWDGRATIDIHRHNLPESWVQAGVYEAWHTNDKRYGFAGLDVDGMVVRLGYYTD